MVTFSKKTVKAFVLENGIKLLEHHMESISFSSIGEGVSVFFYLLERPSPIERSDSDSTPVRKIFFMKLSKSIVR